MNWWDFSNPPVLSLEENVLYSLQCRRMVPTRTSDMKLTKASVVSLQYSLEFTVEHSEVLEFKFKRVSEKLII